MDLNNRKMKNHPPSLLFFSTTLAHGNSKNEIRQAKEEGKQQRENIINGFKDFYSNRSETCTNKIPDT